MDKYLNNNNNPDNTSRIAIIGGGLTGLFTAALLERTFAQLNDNAQLLEITIFEKSRSIGRLATRYKTDTTTQKNWQWAFGAQFFTAKTESFQQFIAPKLQSGLLQPWCATVVDLTPNDIEGQTPVIQPKEQWDAQQARYISTPKMTSWGRALADDLQHTTLRFKTRVAPINTDHYHSKDKKTELFNDKGDSLGHFDWVICTTPNTQAAELLRDSEFSKKAQVCQVKMQACYTLMLGWDTLEQLPPVLRKPYAAWDVAYVSGSPQTNSILDRIFIEHHKPNHDILPSVTIHARNDWSEAHVDDDIEGVKAELLKAAKQALNWGSTNTPSQIDCHRWRYAATLSADDALGILVDDTRQWIVSGDWCAQGNIESGYNMATATVAQILGK